MAGGRGAGAAGPHPCEDFGVCGMCKSNWYYMSVFCSNQVVMCKVDPVVALPQPLAYQDTKGQPWGANPTAKNRHVQTGWRDPIIRVFSVRRCGSTSANMNVWDGASGGGTLTPRGYSAGLPQLRRWRSSPRRVRLHQEIIQQAYHTTGVERSVPSRFDPGCLSLTPTSDQSGLVLAEPTTQPAALHVFESGPAFMKWMA